MGYTENPAMVRVDFFKSSGKWYTTEAIRWSGEWQGSKQDIHAAFAESLRDHFAERPERLSEMDAICLKPYHEHKHPIQIKAGGWNKEQS